MATNTYTALQTVAGSGTTSVTFSSIPSTYTDLVLVMNGTASSPTNVYLRLNGDTGSNYSMTRIVGNGSSASSDRNSNYTAFQSFVGYYDTTVGTSIIQLMNYANTTTYKTALARYNYTTNEVTGAVGLWRSTAAVNSITILTSNSATFPSSTTFTLYGVAAASVGAKATGGTIYQDSSYFYHVFAANGTFTPASSLSADILLVAGGGGGGDPRGGGGGAGGVLLLSSQSLSATGYTCTVGAGGGVATGQRGTSGSNSTFGGLTAAVGGGGGGGDTNSSGSNGGSGGGAFSTGTAGTATSGQGYAGGTGLAYSAGGGGGAGAVGQTAPSSSQAGNGGAGTSTYNSWSLITGVGQNISGTYYLAGGGGGGWGPSSGSGTAGTGGYGGGGNGQVQNSTAATAGLANTGGGGGAGGGVSGSTYGTPAAGGSGVIIVRYAK